MKQNITQHIQEKIARLTTEPVITEIGTVLSVADGIAAVSGLTACMLQERITFEGGAEGIALNLRPGIVDVVLTTRAETIAEGTEATRTNTLISVPVSDAILGRVVQPLGIPIDGQGDIAGKTTLMPIEKIAPGVMTREPVTVPLHTGIKAVDILVPVGRGQRQLIIGDRQTGKTTVAVDAILNQKKTGVVCVYVSIGQKDSTVMRVVNTLREQDALSYTAIVHAGASHGPALQYLAPYAGAAIAEYFMAQGKDVLVVYDDLSKHAVAYRELALLLRRPPGREAYPGDVFYLHSRLLERAGRLSAAYGGGSMTALPIIETKAGDVSAYIPTNVISITDGQLFLESRLFNKNIRPAINVGLSVSRVGGAAQLKATKKNAGALKLQLAQYRELEAFSQFDSDVDAETKKLLERGKRATALLMQHAHDARSVGEHVLMLLALNKGYLDDVPHDSVPLWEKHAIAYAHSHYPSALASVHHEWNEDVERSFIDAITAFKAQFVFPS